MRHADGYPATGRPGYHSDTVVQFSFIPAGETGELADDLRVLFEELATSLAHGQRAYSGECRPALDVLENDDIVEVVVDVAGIPAEAIRIVFRSAVLLIAGEKAPPVQTEPRTFHLVEREFGRFARAVRLTGAFDVQEAKATVLDGELRIVLPKMDDRRGSAQRIPVTASGDGR
jgi:HSP20 family protein